MLFFNFTMKQHPFYFKIRFACTDNDRMNSIVTFIYEVPLESDNDRMNSIVTFIYEVTLESDNVSPLLSITLWSPTLTAWTSCH